MFRALLRTLAAHKKTVIAAALILAIASPLHAQSRATLSGSVHSDSADLPISNAEVYLPALRRGAYTDSAGHFRIENIKPGDYDVVVRRLGFSPLHMQMTLEPDETTAQQFQMTPRPFQLARVKVTAPDTARSLYVDNIMSFEHRRHNGFGSFISEDELRVASDRRLSSVLETIPNLRFYHLAGGAMVAGSEESGRRCYTQIFYDGVKVNFAFDLNSLAPETLRGIEYYSSKTSPPAQFTPSPGYCGALVLWTMVRRD
jgi:Carboxypeptidase regulatory-like domain